MVGDDSMKGWGQWYKKVGDSGTNRLEMVV